MNEGRIGVLVTFLALLELVREGLVVLLQSAPFEPIHVKAHRQDTDDEAFEQDFLDSQEFKSADEPMDLL